MSSSILAYRLLRSRPEINFLILEKEASFSSRETWSFHSSDLLSKDMEWVLPLTSKTWSGYDVVFPEMKRQLIGAQYHSVRSFDLHRKLDLVRYTRFLAEVSSLSDQGVYLRNGEFLSAKCVIDGRGLLKSSSIRAGFQKFVGIDFELSEPHGLSRPLLMDASVEQIDGYRFFYMLPWTESNLLIEDTRYSSSPNYDLVSYRKEIIAYAEKKGLKILRETRIEHASLPIPLKSLSVDNKKSPPMIGTKAGFFHHATGYSFPVAVHVANQLVNLRSYDPNSVKSCLSKIRLDLSPGNNFSSFLNRMLFCGAEPRERRKIFSRFYRLPEPLIQRFYAGKLAKLDYARILIGKPPISVRRAFSAITDHEARLC